jgi:hypothetical protein
MKWMYRVKGSDWKKELGRIEVGGRTISAEEAGEEEAEGEEEAIEDEERG